jgi:Ser/Thr protein kinase RdoA (MazF antagonist)
MTTNKPNLREIAAQFQIDGTYLDGAPYGTGHINDTYSTEWDVGGRKVRRLLQRINHSIFQQPVSLMANIVRVTNHLHGKLSAIAGADPKREALTVIPTRSGESCYRDEAGNYWRAYVFIEGAQTFDVCEGPTQAFAAAKAFGRFQQLLKDLPAPALFETIPFFHDTPRRFATLEQAIEKDVSNRCASAQAEIEFALAHKRITPVVTDQLKTGAIPQRITHNDTKLNNVMIDDVSGEGICVIDLDTVMNGSALYDFGDMVRTCTRTSCEDEPDISKVAIRMDVFEALVRGYLESADFLNAAEVDHLAFAGQLITFTIGIRFLADYLAGDIYFKTHRPGQNLDRARVQFKMVSNMETHAAAMERIVRQYAKG